MAKVVYIAIFNHHLC